MYRHLLVALDGGAASQAALDHAVALAAALGARLQVVHVVDATELPPVAPAGSSAQPDEAVHPARLQAQQWLQRALRQAQAAGVQASTRMLEGRALGRTVGELLADEARASGADLVLVGSQGRRGLDRLFLGSVAEQVARLCTMPVMIVHAAAAAG